MQAIFLIFMFILGACLGSFLCCQARRLHLREAKQGTKLKSPRTNSSSRSKFAGKAIPSHLGSRSVCLHCGAQLKWYDNLPIFSWLWLHGKCRHCHHKIGILEFLSELGVAFALLFISATIDITTARPFDWAIFVVVIIFTLTLAFLAIYDGMCGELPTLCLAISIICAIAILLLREWASISDSGFSFNLIWQPIASVAILGGLYLLLYLVSKGKWVGDGDWLLGVAIGIVLMSPWLALVALFLSNFLACLVMAPLLKGNYRRKIYFGPFLVMAFVITYALADFLQTLF